MDINIMAKNYGNVMALKEYLLSYNKISQLECQLLFGVQNLSAEIARLKGEGYIIKSQKVVMAKILTRINKFTICYAPKNLPIKEIIATEWWINK